MLSKEALEFLLKITDYFHGHFEEIIGPGGPQKPIHQVLILLSAHTWAEGVVDTEARHQIQETIEQAMAEAAQKVGKRPS